MATLQDLVPGSQTDVWGDILEQNLHAINDELKTTTAKANAAPTLEVVQSTAAAAEKRAKDASEPRISRAGAAQGDVVSLGAGGALTFSTPGSGGGPIPTASSTVKGVLLLAGDLGGNSDLPTTPTAVHKTGDEVIDGVKTFLKTPIFAEGAVTGANTLGTLSNPVTDPNAKRPTGLTRVVWDTPTTPVNKLPQDYNLQRGSV